MDIHDEDEVTREPFDDQIGFEEDEDEDQDGQVPSWKQPKYDHRVALGDYHNDEIEMSIEQREAMERDDDESSSVDGDDIKFAKKYGVQLAGSKSQAAAYQRLMNSDYIAGSKSEERSKGGTPRDQEPKIETSTTSDCIYHKGTFYQKGDIVALCDQDDGQLYFAQLTGFLQDQYCEKSATINWLIPTRPTSRDHFDPRAYKIGLEDVQLRKLDCMTFVRNCPHDYYLRKFFQPPTEQPDRSAARPDKGSYIWTSLENLHSIVVITAPKGIEFKGPTKTTLVVRAHNYSA